MASNDLEPPAPHDETTRQVHLALRGDQTSLGWVVTHLTPFLVEDARYRLGRAGVVIVDGDDIVQQAWLICIPKLASLLDDGAGEPRRRTPRLIKFLSTTVLHLVLKARDHARLRQAQPIHGNADLSSADSDNLPADITSVVAKAARNEYAKMLAKALASLDEDLRELVLLRAVEQIPYAVLAQRFGASEGALRVRYSRALDKLRGCFPEGLIDDLRDD